MHLRKDIRLDEILSYLNNRHEDSLDNLNVAILRNSTVENVKPFLSYYFDRLGYKINYYFSSYDSLIKEVENTQSNFYQFKADFVIIDLQLELLSDELCGFFSKLTEAEVNENLNFIKLYIEEIVKFIKFHMPDLTILLHNFALPSFPALGFYDFQVELGQINTIRKLNLWMVKFIKSWKQVYLIDIEFLQNKIGSDNFFDRRYWYLSKIPYSKEVYCALAHEYIRAYQAINAKAKKCLVVDLDNTLWGGIVGEDGVGGIQLDHNYPGSAYRDFQKVILNLYHRGVILAICSKNNEDDIKQVFSEHSDMILKESHFALIKANWSNKVENIKAIVSELNIGIDSIVFVDDSDLEVNLVRAMLPEVTVFQLSDDPSKYATWFGSLDIFDTVTRSQEDQNRNMLYQLQFKRNKHKGQFLSLDDFYASLEIEVSIDFINDALISRVAQLTQRSNQFNLTTKRYSDVEIITKMNSLSSDIFYVTMKDRFGDYGIVAVAIIDYLTDRILIDSFLVSCRVIGYGVANALLGHIIKFSQKKGQSFLEGQYIKTKKNHLVENFYMDNGFEEIFLEGNGNVKRYLYDLSKNYNLVPNYFKQKKRRCVNG